MRPLPTKVIHRYHDVQCRRNAHLRQWLHDMWGPFALEQVPNFLLVRRLLGEVVLRVSGNEWQFELW